MELERAVETQVDIGRMSQLPVKGTDAEEVVGLVLNFIYSEMISLKSWVFFWFCFCYL